MTTKSIPTMEPPLCPESDSDFSIAHTILPNILSASYNDGFMWDLCAAVILSVVTATAIVLWRRERSHNRQSASHCKSPSPTSTTATQASNSRLGSKSDFLKRVGNSYGYAESNRGYIDDWRSSEFPSLISPLKAPPKISKQKQSTEQTQAKGHRDKYDVDMICDETSEPEVYLDYAGSAIPTRTLLSRISNHAQILANPHSQGGGLASDRTLKSMQKTKDRVMHHFGVDHETFGLDELDKQEEEENGRVNATPPYPGYQLVFTSGATESLRIISERFPWNCLKLTARHESRITTQQYSETSNNLLRKLKSVQARSILLYPRNVHTSVIGMRQVAIQRGAQFQCVAAYELLCATHEWFQNMIKKSMSQESCMMAKDTDEEKKDEHWIHQANELSGQHDGTKTLWIHHLLVLPLECNFGGDRFDWSKTIAMARGSSFPLDFHCYDENGEQSATIRICHKWHILMDTAKAAATGPVNLPTLAPDFAVVSFYKMFGAPTGLGALFVKKNQQRKRNKVQVAEDAHTARETQQTESSNMKHNVSKILYFEGRIELEQSLPPRRFFGGGSVDVVLPEEDFMVQRNANSSTSTAAKINDGINVAESETIDLGVMVHGTQHFRGIASLAHGFQELDDLGGMKAIAAHSRCLAAELVRRLGNLAHGNGAPVVQQYGEWKSFVNDSVGLGVNAPGPTVTFNIFDCEGLPIGYDEVSRLATLNVPPIQLRTGCFCNPGACKDAIPLTNSEVLDNYASGHVCGDRRGVVNDKLTGAIRASFGKDSSWEDMDALAMFIENVFVSQKEKLVPSTSLKLSESTQDLNMTMSVRSLFVFPIKSCAAMRVKRWPINCRTGLLLFDREFALVDTSGAAMRLHSYPNMSEIESSIDLDAMVLTVTAPNQEDLILNLDKPNLSAENATSPEDIRVCGTLCKGSIWSGSKASRWFSSVLGVRCWLARHHDAGETEQIASNNRHNAYCNEASLLLISQQSISYLNSVIETQQWGRLVEARHFRPNILVNSTSQGDNISGTHLDKKQKGDNPEDTWQRIIIRGNSGDVELSAIGKCARCQMVDVDPASGMKGNTLRALAQYRRDRGKINFGTFFTGDINASEEMAWLEEGDEIQASSVI